MEQHHERPISTTHQTSTSPAWNEQHPERDQYHRPIRPKLALHGTTHRETNINHPPDLNQPCMEWITPRETNINHPPDLNQPCMEQYSFYCCMNNITFATDLYTAILHHQSSSVSHMMLVKMIFSIKTTKQNNLYPLNLQRLHSHRWVSNLQMQPLYWPAHTWLWVWRLLVRNSSNRIHSSN